MKTKYIFVTGGVVSGLGKGITAASLGRLLKSRGYRVTLQKFDPYINIDPGTMSPYQHGEVFVMGRKLTSTSVIMKGLLMKTSRRTAMLQRVKFTSPLLKRNEEVIIWVQPFRLFRILPTK